LEPPPCPGRSLLHRLRMAAAGAAAAEAVPRFCVLGGGLAGLASAFFLQRSFPLARVRVVGRREQGLIASARGSRGQVLEQGFHTSMLNNRNGREALGLARLLGLEEEVLSANVEASARRHLLLGGRVQLFPKLQHSLRFGPALLAEPLWPCGRGEDESVHAFVARRTSTAVADNIADPICRGQLAGDARSLSVRTCFPRLWYNERRFKSIFVGSFFSVASAYRQRSWLSLDLLDPLQQRISAGGRCYSFRSGMGTLLERLETALQEPPLGTRPTEILREAAVAGVRANGTGPPAEVLLDDGRSLEADAVVAAVPPYELARILSASGLDVPHADASGASLSKLLAGVEHESVAVVGVSFNDDVLRGRFRGAGYFAGSREQQDKPVLGMSWDSQLFPEQDPQPGATRLTVYVAGQEGPRAAEDAALAAVRAHLGVDKDPEEVATTEWPKAVPQYAVGHRQMMRAVDAARRRHLPWLQVAGGGFLGTRSAADDIVDARKLADAMARRFARFPGLVENEAAEDVAPRYGGGFDTE